MSGGDLMDVLVSEAQVRLSQLLQLTMDFWVSCRSRCAVAQRHGGFLVPINLQEAVIPLPAERIATLLCALQVIKMRVSQGALKRGCFAPQVGWAMLPQLPPTCSAPALRAATELLNPWALLACLLLM